MACRTFSPICVLKLSRMTICSACKLGCIGYLGHPFKKVTPWAFTTLRFLSVRWDSAIDRGREWFLYIRENRRVWAADHQGGIHRLQERSTTDHFRHDAPSWMDLVLQLESRPCSPASGSPVVVMVQTSHNRKSNHLVPCIWSARNCSALFRYVLCNPLMGSCLVEVGHIRASAHVEAASPARSAGDRDTLAAHSS